MPKRAVFDDDLEDEIYDVRYQAEEEEDDDPIQPFLDDGTLLEVIDEVKSGKEGTVFVCRGNPYYVPFDLVAAKVFRSRAERTFRNRTVYQEGVVILNGRNERAFKKKTAWGRTFEEGVWKYHEYEVLKALSDAGADVPKPLKLSERVLLMEYIGDDEGPAPKLQGTDLPADQVGLTFARILRNIELLLRMNYVHGDLSAYNVLYWNGNITIIDFPQTVDPRFNRNALQLLSRDLKNICAYFNRRGMDLDHESIARRMWRQYMRAEL